MTKTSKITIYLSLFLSGTSVMVFELVAPRLFAPYFGTSTYIWTIVIGVVMTSLSLGYYLGGKLADAKPSLSTLAYLFTTASIISFIVFLSKDFALHSIYILHRDIISGTFRLSLIILAPLNLVLGMVSPLGVRLLTRTENESGSSSGNVYAISTVGSIAGTFATGFYLIPKLGLSDILFGVSIILIICALILSSSFKNRVINITILLLFYLIYSTSNPNKIFKSFYEKSFGVKIIADFQTKYGRSWIQDKIFSNIGTERILADGQSSIFLNKPISFTMEKKLSYYSFFNLAPTYNKNVQKVLMIGAGAYTYANYLQTKYPDVDLDVVEIDGELLGIAKEYFNFVPGNNFRNFVMDGRDYLNKNTDKYDVIYLDAYRNGASTPFQLITKEAMSKLSNALTPNGLLFINIISSLDGKGSKLLISEYKTVKSIFEDVLVFPVFKPDPSYRQNIVLVASQKKLNLDQNSRSPKPISDMDTYLDSGIILTDNYAPVEYYDLQSSL